MDEWAMSSKPLRKILFLLLLLVLPASSKSSAYSLLTHEQLIDLAWKDSIVPASPEPLSESHAAQLDEARAYAYGGCVIQDIGYYPFGDRLSLT